MVKRNEEQRQSCRIPESFADGLSSPSGVGDSQSPIACDRSVSTSTSANTALFRTPFCSRLRHAAEVADTRSSSTPKQREDGDKETKLGQ